MRNVNCIEKNNLELMFDHREFWLELSRTGKNHKAGVLYNLGLERGSIPVCTCFLCELADRRVETISKIRCVVCPFTHCISGILTQEEMEFCAPCEMDESYYSQWRHTENKKDRKILARKIAMMPLHNY